MAGLESGGSFPHTVTLHTFAALAARLAGCQAAMSGVLCGERFFWAVTDEEAVFRALAGAWPQRDSPLYQIRDGLWDGPMVQRTDRRGWWTNDLAAWRQQAPSEWAAALAPFGSLAVLPGFWLERVYAWVITVDKRPQALTPGAISLVEDLVQNIASAGHDVIDLQRSEERYRAIAEVSNHLAYSFAVSPEGHLELDWATDSFETVLGHPRSEAYEPDGLSQMVHPDDLPKWRQRVKHLLAGESQVSVLRIVRRDGQVRWLRISARPELCPVTGRVHYINGAALDLTSRREIDARLRASEATLRGIVEHSRDGVMLTDTQGRVTLWNSAIEHISGIQAESALGQPLWKLYAQTLPEEMRPCAQEQAEQVLHAALESGDLSWAHTPVDHELMRPDEMRRTLQTSVFAVPNDGGYLVGGLLRDITERVALEREAQRRAADYRQLQARTQTAVEDERARISRMIHDEVGQVLTALGFDLRWLQGRSRRASSEVRAKLEAMAVELGDTIKKVQQLATELYPTLLDHLGLCAAIEWQAKQFQERTGIACETTFEPADCQVERQRATSLYRIMQEALTNVARHAQATHTWVSLVREAHQLTLSVRDNGRGITEAEIHSPEAMGLMGMHERAERWGGTCNIQGAPGRGTEVRVIIPLGEEFT